MTLGQFATAVGARPRWVLNALTRLKVPRRYSERLARRLCLARLLAEDVGMTLAAAYRMAGKALEEADPSGTWRHESLNAAIALSIDMPRFYTAYGAGLALSRQYSEKVRGRRPSKLKSAVQRAREYGIDTTLLEAQLARTPAQRVRELDENLEFLRRVRMTP